MTNRRVVVTGVGMIAPLGNDVKSNWESILAGKSGIGKLKHFDATNFPTNISGELKNFEYKDYFNNAYVLKKIGYLDVSVHYSNMASNQALIDAGFSTTEAIDTLDKARVGVIVSGGVNGVTNHYTTVTKFYKQGKSLKVLSPYFISAHTCNTNSSLLTIEHGFTGVSANITTACATSNHSIIFGMMNIVMGFIDMCVVGGADAAIEPCTFGGFCRMKGLSRQFNDEPERASRPYDKDRDGFVMSEGAGAFVLEEYEHAKKRGANIYAELIGFGMTSDAYELVKPHPEGKGAHQSMMNALSYAKINADEIDYINAHATSTPLGDKAESLAILKLMNNKQDGNLHVGSTKSIIGHMLGAAGAVEAIFCLLAMRDNKVPPNINIDNFDDEVGLNETTVNQEVIEKDINITMSNSFGFGGHNSSLLFKKI